MTVTLDDKQKASFAQAYVSVLMKSYSDGDTDSYMAVMLHHRVGQDEDGNVSFDADMLVPVVKTDTEETIWPMKETGLSNGVRSYRSLNSYVAASGYEQLSTAKRPVSISGSVAEGETDMKLNLVSYTDVPEQAVGKNDVVAFAGIGHPQKFYHSLKEQGFNVLKTYDFPDHHFYSKKELEKIIIQAQKLNADVYTTSKDFVKIPPSLQNSVKVLEISVVWNKPEELLGFIKSGIKK